MRDLFPTREIGVLATHKRDGRPQLSNVNYVYDPTTDVLRVSVTADRAKARNLFRDPRASFHVTSADAYAWTVAEGTVELGPVAEHPEDAAVEDQVAHYRASTGEHPDWPAYRALMVAERRLMIRLGVDRVYGQCLEDLAAWQAARES
nr:PPOX class F420-dependent oxidoreductase [Streptomyces sp. SID3343]